MKNNPRSAGPKNEGEQQSLRDANVKARRLIESAVNKLLVILDDEPIMGETPLEAQDAIESAIETMRTTLRCLETVDLGEKLFAAHQPGGPTCQQGQFLAFIHEYVMRNEAGVAPTHAAIQRYFNLTAPSVNSMLIRLEKLGFIQRIPGKARGIELIISPEKIPQLERPFKF
jgi:hypothetical protein